MLNNIPKYVIPHFSYPFTVNGHLCFFNLLANIHNATMNMGGQISSRPWF